MKTLPHCGQSPAGVVGLSEPAEARVLFPLRPFFFSKHVTDKNSKQRRKLSKVRVYTVKDGKIAREEFLPRVD
jgi:hypothetical protein